jgi:hypothetical protein
VGIPASNAQTHKTPADTPIHRLKKFKLHLFQFLFTEYSMAEKRPDPHHQGEPTFQPIARTCQTLRALQVLVFQSALKQCNSFSSGRVWLIIKSPPRRTIFENRFRIL